MPSRSSPIRTAGSRSCLAVSFRAKWPGAGSAKTPLPARCPSTLCRASRSQPVAVARSAMPVVPPAMCSATRSVTVTWTHQGVARSVSVERSAGEGSLMAARLRNRPHSVPARN
ncbi:MAG: hypothetical protein AVDCRST_MAG10-2558 [uncultured Acidimicrobiales bacterium]|uniref:Uncharacterized protein n=1 Tax=uncultured Acidimicrobiales bacterium TaxID=310071 RepID=A0A6J4IRB5_9ACTN|nr:MAG: hypothetical protein AVDCRST_MAG10-2558 [uncultured Acidimicrobiales bacterium]